MVQTNGRSRGAGAFFGGVKSSGRAREGGVWLGGPNIRRFDGARFTEVIAAPPGDVFELTEAPDGALWAAVDEGVLPFDMVWRWDGTSWTDMQAGHGGASADESIRGAEMLVHGALAETQVEIGDAGALAACRDAVARAREAVEKRPQSATGRRRLALALERLAGAYGGGERGGGNGPDGRHADCRLAPPYKDQQTSHETPRDP